MRRRKFLAIAGAAPVWAANIFAQALPRRIAVLQFFADTDQDTQSWLHAFRHELEKFGWREGHNIEFAEVLDPDVCFLEIARTSRVDQFPTPGRSLRL